VGSRKKGLGESEPSEPKTVELVKKDPEIYNARRGSRGARYEKKRGNFRKLQEKNSFKRGHQPSYMGGGGESLGGSKTKRGEEGTDRWREESPTAKKDRKRFGRTGQDPTCHNENF